MGNSKSKIKTVTLPQEVLEQLKCGLCKKYLSSSPIRLLSDGKTMCGRCSVPPTEINFCRRVIQLEVAVSHVMFPCSYKDYGCTKQLLFDHCLDHETKCVYCPFLCPSLPFTTCSWTGSVAQIQDHFCQNHVGFVNSKGVFQLDISINKYNILMIIHDGVAFLIKYKYEASNSILEYDIKYFSPYIFNENFKIQLINSLNPENSINLKGDKCLPYAFHHSTFQSNFSLTLNKFLAVLANPTIIDIEIILPPIKVTSTKPTKSLEIINYGLLESLRCAACQNYLSLPIFDGPTGTVCSDCNENYSPSNNEELHRSVAEANYPCRWNNCKVICKGHSIRVHEMICPHYPHKCPMPRCYGPVLTAADAFAMEMHFSFVHGCQLFSKSTSFSTKSMVDHVKNVVSITKNNEIILGKFKLTAQRTATYEFELVSFKPGSSVTAEIHFGHSHCKLKSRKLTCKSNNSVSINKEVLPKCFNINKKMMVFIELQQ